jgi:hypothetical protein
MKMKELAERLREVASYIDWESEVIDDAHLYAQRFGASAGSNVFEFVLQDALRYRGETLERMRAAGKTPEGQ